ncbi:MAG: dolichyl-phosphate beta-glucosyltransferase [Patescibacteria group bacterium]
MSQPFLSVIIPSYNELNNLNRGVLEQVNDYLKKQDYSWEVILTDDGSTDGTLEKLVEFCQQHPNFHVLANDHAGKGPTVKSGMLSAQGEWRLFTDFDQSTPIGEVKKLLNFTNQYDIVLGSREGDGSKRDTEPFYRHIMGRGFNLLVQLLAVPGLRDTQCGFKIFSARATNKLFGSLYIYGQAKSRKDAFTGAFDVELLFLAKKYGYKFIEVPIFWKHYKSDRVSPIRDSLRMLLDIVKIRLADLSGKYN